MRGLPPDEEPPGDFPIGDDQPPESYSPNIDTDAQSPVAEPTASIEMASSCTTTRSFIFCGQGYKSCGDWPFARSQGDSYVESRRLSWEALMDDRAFLAEFGQ